MNPNEPSSAPVEKKSRRSDITKKILSETSEEARSLTKDYWKGRADQYEIDQEENARLRSLIEKAFYENNGYQYTWEQFKKDNNL